LATAAQFSGSEIVITEKRDGENTTLYSDGFYHARSLDGRGAAYQSWVARMWAERCADLAPGFRVCGENLFARHSIAYDDLADFFEVFAVIDDANRRLSWDEIVAWCDRLRLRAAPLLFRGAWDETSVRKLWSEVGHAGMEGYVVATAGAFDMACMDKHVAKFVRRDHVRSDRHWTQGWTPNRLAPRA
jgi:hypothetical protein